MRAAKRLQTFHLKDKQGRVVSSWQRVRCRCPMGSSRLHWRRDRARQRPVVPPDLRGRRRSGGISTIRGLASP